MLSEDWTAVVPAVHDASAVPPVSTRYLPSPQAVHDASAFCPVTTPYFPAPHSVQSADPISKLYIPATHAVQTSDVAIICAENLPRIHFVHVADPLVPL